MTVPFILNVYKFTVVSPPKKNCYISVFLLHTSGYVTMHIILFLQLSVCALGPTTWGASWFLVGCKKTHCLRICSDVQLNWIWINSNLNNFFQSLKGDILRRSIKIQAPEKKNSRHKNPREPTFNASHIDSPIQRGPIAQEGWFLPCLSSGSPQLLLKRWLPIIGKLLLQQQQQQQEQQHST